MRTINTEQYFSFQQRVLSFQQRAIPDMALDLRKFLPRPKAVAKRDYNIYFVIAFICLLASITTLILITFASYKQNLLLALLNIFGLTATLYVVYVAKQGRLFFAIGIICFCLYFYCVNASILFGWHAGFQYYLIAITAILYLHPYFRNRVALLIGLLPFITFLYLYFSLNQQESLDSNLSSVLHTINTLMVFLSIGFTNFYFRSNILGLVNKLDRDSKSDRLTGLMNRHFMTAELTRYCNIIERYKKTSSILLIDIDNFEHVNEQYGHYAGDQVLKQFSTLVQERLRESDVLARWGDDEFMILAPYTSLEEATHLAEKLQAACTENFFNYEKLIIDISITQAVIELLPLRAVEDSLKKVDALLHEAKQHGPNRVIVEAQTY